MTSNMFEVRECNKEDSIAVEEMIRELAIYENLLNEPLIDHKMIEKDGFGDHKHYWIFVANLLNTKQLIGYSLSFFKNSTENDKYLYMKDLFVKSDYRNYGVGRALLKAVAKCGADHNCNRLEWRCWNWNHNSIEFYKKLGGIVTVESEGWLYFREGVKEDCIAIEGMIKELAVYEKMPNGPEIDHKVLERDGFGDERLYWILVVEMVDSGQQIGFALFFNKYSTWSGKCLWLEDLYVKPQYRGRGIGRDLLTAVVNYALDHSYNRLEWSCLDWNHSSICFYKKFGATDLTESEGWHTFRLTKQQLQIKAKLSKTNE